MVVELRRLSPNDGADVYNMLQEIPKDENGFLNGCNGMSYEDYEQWLIQSENMANGTGLEDWMVPQINYWLYVDEKPVGMGKLRIRLTEKLKTDGGHCGYTIISSQRNKGYGELLLKLLVEEAGKLGIAKVLLTINSDNEASKRIAIRNGGIVEKVSDSKHYIWIDCNTSL